MGNVSKKDREKEIQVRAPFFIRRRYGDPEVKAMTEELRFFNACRRISRYAALPIVGINLLILLLTLKTIWDPSQSSFLEPLSVSAMFFIGVMNILSGLLLLARE